MSKGLLEETVGIGLIAGAMFIPGGQVFSFLGMTFKGSQLAEVLITAGAGLAMQPIGTMLTGTDQGS